MNEQRPMSSAHSDAFRHVLIVAASERQRTLMRAAIVAEHPGSVVDDAVDGTDAIIKYRMQRPDLTLLDLGLAPRGEAQRVLGAIRAKSPDARVIGHTTLPGLVAGYATLLGIPCLAMADTGSMDHFAHRAALAVRGMASTRHQPGTVATMPGHTRSDRRVLRLMASGMAEADIAEELGVMPKTLKRRMRKLSA